MPCACCSQRRSTMNKFLAISLALVASACGGEKSPTAPPPTTEQPTEPPPGTAALIVTLESDTLPFSMDIHIRAQRQTYQGRMELTLGYCVPPPSFSTWPCGSVRLQILDFEEH